MFSRNKVLTTGLLIVVFYTVKVLSDLVVETPSLYLPDEDRVINFNGTNFTNTIFQEERQVFWVVEFYNHWCGDCIRFVDVMKAAADGLRDWGFYIKVGAINCDSNASIGVCRNLNITGVPTIRVFAPYSHKGALGVDLEINKVYDKAYGPGPQETSQGWQIVHKRVTDDEKDNAMKWENDVKKALNISHLSTKVFSVDLQTTLYYIFTVEVAQKNTIAGEPLKALKEFVTVIVKYFPATEPEKKFLIEFKSFLDGKESVTGININETFVDLEHKYKPFAPKLNWLACRGTTPVFRGYPCGLWTLFHTLVASEELQKRNSSSKTPEALYAVGGYVKHLFSSVRGSADWELAAGSANTTEQAVVWLWKAHNLRNGQFWAYGSGSTDPYHGKRYFPTKKQCESCYDGMKRNDSKVFDFLSNMYTNIIHIDQKVLQSLL